MLTADQIEVLGDKAQKITEPIIEFLIQDIARRISEAGQLTSTASYQTWRLQNLGMSQQQVKKEIAKRLKISMKQVDQLMTQAAEVGYNFDLKNLPTSGTISFAENETIQQIVSAAVQLAQDDLSNMVQTIGFVNHDGIARPLTQAYQQACDFAFTKVATGAQDYNSAIREATRELAKKGIRTIDYESGAHASLDAAVRRNVMGGLGLMQERISQQNHDALGADGWEISAHAASAPDHEPIQGRQYSDAEYTDLNNSLVRRIGTLNCGHAAFPIIMGVNSPQYTQEELEKFRKDNETGIEYEGKHYTMYEATQRQRKLERSIRKCKRDILIDEAAGDEQKLQTDQIKLVRLNDEYARFTKAAGLRSQRERANIAGFGPQQARAAEKAEKAIAKKANEMFSFGNSQENIDAYLREKPVIDRLASYGIKYIKRIDAKEIIVNAGKPTVLGSTIHALDNLSQKVDRAEMTVEKAQEFVDYARLTIYQQERDTLKYLAQEGYAVLNLDHYLVTAVPQKWRKKYDKFLQEVTE